MTNLSINIIHYIDDIINRKKRGCYTALLIDNSNEKRKIDDFTTRPNPADTSRIRSSGQLCIERDSTNERPNMDD